MSSDIPRVAQSKGGIARRLTTIEMDAVWEEVQARHRNGLGWIPRSPEESVPCETEEFQIGVILW